MGLFHLSTEFTKKEKKKQKEKETTAATNLNSYKFCVDKREQYMEPVNDISFSVSTLCLEIQTGSNTELFYSTCK